MTDFAKPLPQNLDAERAILGAVLQDDKALDDAGTVSQGDFFLHEHATILRTMREIADRNEPIDLVTLSEKLRYDGKLEATGGAPYLASLADGTARISNVGHYAKTVREKAVLRRAIHLAERILNAAFEGGEVESVLDTATQGYLDLAIEGASGGCMGKSYRDAAVSLMRGFDTRSRKPVLTGLEKLDKATGGFFGGELITFTASTGAGKTLLAQQIRRFACGTGLDTLYCSGEMTAEHLVSRELATEALIEHWKMRRPERLEDTEYKALMNVCAHECDRCRILDGELSLRGIRMAARRLKRATGLDLVVLDYDELIDAPGKNELEQQRELVRGAKRLGVELNVPLIIISQLRKPLDAKESAKPTLEKIYGSGAKSKHSSWIFHIDRPYVRDLEGENGEELFPRRWNEEYIDAPVVKHQNQPSTNQEGVEGILKEATGQYRVLYALLAGCGPLRAGEALGLEISKHISNDCRTVYIRQKAKRGEIQPYLKTQNGERDVDLCKNLAAMLKDFIGIRTSGLLFCTSTGAQLLQSNTLQDSLHPILRKLQHVKGGFNIFRRYRITHLKKSDCPGALEHFWSGHAQTHVSERYTKLWQDREYRLEWAEKIGMGFELPKASVARLALLIPFRKTG
jgi:replicative DNA helicase